MLAKGRIRRMSWDAWAPSSQASRPWPERSARMTTWRNCRSFKPLIDTIFSGMTFDEAAWDMLDSDEKKKIQDIVLAGKVDKRRLMAERAKARLDWYSFILFLSLFPFIPQVQ